MTSGVVWKRSCGRGVKCPAPCRSTPPRLGRNHAHARQQRAVAGNQLAGLDGDALVAHQVQQHLAAAQRHRLTLGRVVGFGGVARPFDVQGTPAVEQSLLDGGDAGSRVGGDPFGLWKTGERCFKRIFGDG